MWQLPHSKSCENHSPSNGMRKSLATLFIVSANLRFVLISRVAQTAGFAVCGSRRVGKSRRLRKRRSALPDLPTSRTQRAALPAWPRAALRVLRAPARSQVVGGALLRGLRPALVAQGGLVCEAGRPGIERPRRGFLAMRTEMHGNLPVGIRNSPNFEFQISSFVFSAASSAATSSGPLWTPGQAACAISGE
jgi:hypothetical protein